MTITPQHVVNADELKLPVILGELAEFNLKRFSEYTALYFEGREITNVQLAEEARRLAGGLRALGIKPGDRVVVMLVNSPEVLVAYQAIARVGAVVVPLLPVLKTAEVQHIAANCQPRAIITNLPLVEVIKPALAGAQLPEPAHIIATGEPDEVKAAGGVSYRELMEQSEPYTDPPPNQPGDPAIILYTSGTTGQPKGVMLSHQNQISNLITVYPEEYLLGKVTRPPEYRLAALPLAHAMGLTGSNHLYLSGDPFVMLPRFDPQKVLEAIEKYRIMRMSLVPAMLVALLNYPDADKYDTSSWQTVVCGSAPLPVSVLQGVQQKFGVTVLEGYGLSEANTAVSGHRLDMKLKPGSVGQPLSGVEVQIVDLDDNPLPPNERGEVVVRGPNIMLGYYNNPQATAATIRNGWLHTGDVGYLDEEGYLYIVERKKDLIIRGGQNIYPRDSEEVLAKHPAVREVAVVGVPSEKYGEEVKAYVVRYPGETVTEEELIEYCQQFLAKYKTPAYIEFIEALPRNPVGKINKRALRELNH